MKIFVCAAAAAAALAVLAKPSDAAFPDSVAALMDTTVDPCDNFYQYTCGNWIKNYTLANDTQSYSYSFGSIEKNNEATIQEIIKDDWPIVSELWDSCMALDAMTALGSKPLQRDLDRIAATVSLANLAKLAGELGSIGPGLFTASTTLPDKHDATTNVLFSGYIGLVLPDASYYLDPDMFQSIEGPFRKYISTLVKLAGINANANANTNPPASQSGGGLLSNVLTMLQAGNGNEGPAQHQQQGGYGSSDTKPIEDIVIAIETEFAKIAPTDEELADYHALTYGEAQAKYPLTFQAMTQGRSIDQAKITADSHVVFDSLPFMDRVEQFFSSQKLDELKLYYSALYVIMYARFLGDDFAQADFDFFGKALQGAVELPPRATICTGSLIDELPDLIGKYYFLKAFDIEREQQVEAMVATIEKVMGEHIEKLTWLDDATRAEAEAKLRKVSNLIGRSTQKESYPFVLKRDNYFDNVQAVWTNSWARQLAKINQPVDRSEWFMSAATVNAYYDPQMNQMVFPAAILQPPFFSGGVHPVQNFGAIGAVIGHELTHGFDNNGRHYDGDGNQRDWFTPASADEFEARATCMRNQYSQFEMFGESGKSIGFVNGNLTIGENIADNGGVSLSFDAYHEWAKTAPAINSNGVNDDEVDKLFFVSYGQVWCAKTRDELQKQWLVSDVHAPAQARINGVVMNSEAFADTFKCKAGSKMNPETKCKLWQA